MPVHIEGFGSLETVAKTKGEIFSCLSATGTAVINFDDQFYSQWLQQVGDAAVVRFSQSKVDADIYSSAVQIQASGAPTFRLHSKIGGAADEINIQLPLLGEHNISNALAAAAAAIVAGASLGQVKAGLEQLVPVAGRLKTIALAKQTLIDDSYNANPDSVKAAIDVLAGFAGERWLVLGTMGELGAMAEQGHHDVAAYARAKGIEKLLVVGEYGKLMTSVFGGGCAYQEMAGLLADLEQFTTASAILVKGSRSARMERVVAALIKNNGGQH